jgi:short-subunit dehydrogenase
MTDKSSLTGKYAIVTGSTQGLGEAIARLFVERGVAGLIICGRKVERGNAVAASLNSDTCKVHFVQCDLANVEDCRRCRFRPIRTRRCRATDTINRRSLISRKIINFTFQNRRTKNLEINND